jgi:hypothetical protein
MRRLRKNMAGPGWSASALAQHPAVPANRRRWVYKLSLGGTRSEPSATPTSDPRPDAAASPAP